MPGTKSEFFLLNQATGNWNIIILASKWTKKQTHSQTKQKSIFSVFLLTLKVSSNLIFCECACASEDLSVYLNKGLELEHCQFVSWPILRDSWWTVILTFGNKNNNFNMLCYNLSFCLGHTWIVLLNLDTLRVSRWLAGQLSG